MSSLCYWDLLPKELQSFIQNEAVKQKRLDAVLLRPWWKEIHTEFYVLVKPYQEDYPVSRCTDPNCHHTKRLMCVELWPPFRWIWMADVYPIDELLKRPRRPIRSKWCTATYCLLLRELS